MKNYIIYILSALSLGVFSGCTAIREDSTADGPGELSFTASVGSFQVKATDTAFERGDEIGLFADAPVNARNVRMSWDGSNLVPDQKLFWMPGQERTTFFTAYYPYNADVTDTWAGFRVNADQSTHELYTASDLMTARTADTSPEGLVNFNFFHRLSKIVITIENNIEGAEVSEVYLSNVYGKYECYLGADYFNGNVLGQPGTIKAGKVTTADGNTAWTVIIPPQYGKPNLIVTTTDGRQYTGWTDYNIWFDGGWRYGANAVLDGESVLTDFTSEVTEWTDNNDIAFSGHSGEVSTIQEVIEGPEGEEYTVTGRVASIANTTYGNYYIEDETGSIYIYGTRTEDGLYPRDAGGWYSEAFSLVIGDEVTVTGPKTIYNGTCELVDCRILDVSRAPLGVVQGGTTLSGAASSFYVDVRSADGGIGITDLPDWVSVDGMEQFGDCSYGIWYRIYLVAEANPDSVSRTGVVAFVDYSGNLAFFGVSQGAAVQEYDSITPVIQLDDYSFVAVSGIVHAVSTRGFMLYDGEYALFVYTSSTPAVSIGDMVKVTGTKTTYSDVPEIYNYNGTGLTVSLIGGNYGLYDDSFPDYGEQIATYGARIADYSIPFSVSGTLSYNDSNAKYVLSVSDAPDYMVEVYWPQQDLSSYVDKEVRLYGYYNGWRNNITYIVLRAVEEL